MSFATALAVFTHLKFFVTCLIHSTNRRHVSLFQAVFCPQKTHALC